MSERLRRAFVMTALALGVAYYGYFFVRGLAQTFVWTAPDSGSAGIGAVSVGLSEGLIEGLVIWVPIAVAFRMTRPTRLRNWLRGLRVAVVLLTVVWIASIILMSGDRPTAVVLVYALFSGAGSLFLIVPFYILAALALRIFAPVA